MGDIRFEQLVAVFLRQADPVIDDVDDDLAAGFAQAHVDPPGVIVGVALDGGHRLGRVLDDIGERLGDEPCVHARAHRLLRNGDRNGQVGIGHLHHEHRFAHHGGDVLGGEAGFGHAREGRELVHHAADIADLADDRFGALVEHVAVVGDDPAIFALQSLGRELDRGQRVLDFMGDAAGDIGPGRGALRLDEIGDVVERDDEAVVGGVVPFERHAGGDDPLAAVPGDRHLFLNQSDPVDLGAPQKVGDLRQDAGDRLSETVLAANQFQRRAVGDRDPTFGVDADDAGRHAGQDGFDEAAAFVHLAIDGEQRIALAVQLRRHQIERAGEPGQIALAALGRHAHIEIAACHLARGADQPPDRRDQPIGEADADPDRR